MDNFNLKEGIQWFLKLFILEVLRTIMAHKHYSNSKVTA